MARLCEVLVEHPTIRLFTLFGLDREVYSLVVTVIGGFADVLGVLCLVIGFVQTIRVQKAQEKTIHSLESLLPMCASCKKYRAEDGVWHPIEKYLLESGSPDITHGLCPECAATMRKEMKKFMESSKNAALE
jgi:hypothetical protein